MAAIPRLLLVTEPSRSRLPLLDLASEAVAGGVDSIYLRASEADRVPTVERIHALRERIGDQVTLLVNDAELAAATGIGLHLRERDPIPYAVSPRTPVSSRGNVHRDLVSTSHSSPEKRDSSCNLQFVGMTSMAGMTQLAEYSLVGRSVHSPEEAAISVGLDYLLAGHVYPSASKPGKPPLGLDGLRAIVAVSPCPVLAIGGITAACVPEVVRAGAHGVAVIGAIAEADDPRAAAQALRSALDDALQHQMHEEQRHMSAKEEANASVLNGTAAIELTVNGKNVSVPAGATVHDFLASKKMTDAMAIVERNGEIVPRGEYGATTLSAGDQLEVVHAVGGG
jgi:thiamine biosynthesis protein ThiS